MIVVRGGGMVVRGGGDGSEHGWSPASLRPSHHHTNWKA